MTWCWPPSRSPNGLVLQGNSLSGSISPSSKIFKPIWLPRPLPLTKFHCGCFGGSPWWAGGGCAEGPKSQFPLGDSHTQALAKLPGALNGLEDSTSNHKGFSFNHQHLHFLEWELARGPGEATELPLSSPPLVRSWGQACPLLRGLLWAMKGGQG